MQEVTITSGRNMHLIDPHLEVWGWEIPVYLFIGGLVAGILFFSALYYLRGKSAEMRTVVSVTPLLAPLLLGLGLFALFLDLEYKLHVFRFYTNIRLESPMSWGSWTLAVIFPLSTIWAFIQLPEVFPGIKWPFAWLAKAVNLAQQYARTMAWVLIIYAILLGMYTGILLSAFNARPVWNSAILGPLFLVSGLSTGIALNLLFSKSETEKRLLSKIDVMAIGVELFLIIHLFMGMLAATEIQIQAAHLFLGGPYTASFWIFVVALGLVMPILLEVLELKGRVAGSRIPALMVLAGGFLLRYIIVEAGQISSWVY
jgi:formate-dependent nitrite reductase membrane component NrfD